MQDVCGPSKREARHVAGGVYGFYNRGFPITGLAQGLGLYSLGFYDLGFYGLGFYGSGFYGLGVLLWCRLDILLG